MEDLKSIAPLMWIFFISLLPVRMAGVASKLVEPRPFEDTHASKLYTQSALVAQKAEKLVLDQYKADKGQVPYIHYIAC